MTNKMQTDFDSVFSDCSEFKELLIIEPEKEEKFLIPKESVSRGKVKKKKGETKKVEAPTTKELKENKVKPIKEKKSDQKHSQKGKRDDNTPKIQNIELYEKKQGTLIEQNVLAIVKEIQELKAQKLNEKQVKHSHKDPKIHIPKIQNLLIDKKSSTQNLNEKSSTNTTKPAIVQPQKKESSKPNLVKTENKHETSIKKKSNENNTDKAAIIQPQKKESSKPNIVKTENKNETCIKKKSNESNTDKAAIIQPQKKESSKPNLVKTENKNETCIKKKSNESNTDKPAIVQPQKKESSKPNLVKTENKNETIIKKKSNENNTDKQTNREHNSIEKLLKARDSHMKKRDKSLEQTINKLKKLEEENIDKLEKSEEGITLQEIANETRLLENTISLLQQINADEELDRLDKLIISEDIKDVREIENHTAAKLKHSMENNPNLLKEIKHSKEKNENQKEVNKSKECSETILKQFKRENTEILEKTIENKLKDHKGSTRVDQLEPENSEDILDYVIPPEEVVQIQERNLLLSKIEDMEKLHTKLELHLIAQHSLPEGTNLDLSRIHNKFDSLQRENKSLERRIVFLMQHNFERMDDLKDNLRYLTKQETDVVYTYKALKAKMPEIEKVQASNAKLLNKIQEVPVSKGSTTIQDLQAKLAPLENAKGRLDSHLQKLKRDQIELNDRLKHKKRMNVLEKAENETEIKKLQATCRFLGDVKRDLVKKFETAKMKVRESSICEIEKIKKLELTLQELSGRYKKLSNEKKELEKINTSLKDKVVKKNQELNSKEIYVG